MNLFINMLKQIVPVLALGLLAVLLTGIDSSVRAMGNDTPTSPLDVNDISYLWPAKTADDVNALISLDDKLADGSDVLSQQAFTALTTNALQVRVNDSSGRPNQINFAQFAKDFQTKHTWKIAAFRIDPSAPGTAPTITKTFGSFPQIRLIAQPVTVDTQGHVKIHDTTAHIVFSFFTGTPPNILPDKQAFADIVNDAVALKQFLKDQNVTTAGLLSVHPGLKANVPGFSTKVKAMLQKRLGDSRLNAMAFMGIDPPEPWIFFALVRTPIGAWTLPTNQAFPGSAQMLIQRGGDAVCPQPTPLNIDGKRGVSTSTLFASNIVQKLDLPAFTDLPNLKLKDIPDYIANPDLSHFFTTDCISCHSESTRRSILNLGSFQSAFKFPLPAGISGLDPAVAPKGIWNVRNFGWGDTSGVPTISQRTANEAANSADFINKNYLSKPKANAVSHPLTLVMTIKGDKELNELKAFLASTNSGATNPITTARDKLATVHFARFVFLDDRHLMIITTFDNDFDAYIDAFVNEIGPVFDELLKGMDKAPPLPVSDHRQEFLKYVKDNDKAAAAFYSAYPDLRVLDIKTLQKKQGDR